jgi:hypothetical protein
MTRIDEAENRLHILFDILSFIPTHGIRVSFMNTRKVLTFSTAGKTPEQFQREAHDTISEAFAHLNMGGTPTRRTLQDGFADADNYPTIPTAHFLLTDGVPSDCSVEDLIRQISARRDPKRNPLTLISCTNVESECEWMKEVCI